MKDLKLSLIVAAIDRATAPLRRIGAGLKGLEDRAGKVHKAFKRLGVGEMIGGAFFAGAAIEATRGVWELTRGTAEFGVQALHASQKAAMTVEQIQKLQFAAKMLDVDADNLGETMFRFNQHVVMAATGSKREERALRAMGLEIKDSHGKLKPLYDLFLQFSDAFSKMDARKANFAAFTMLGRGGVQSIPLLKAGSAALQAYGKQAEAMGVIMDQETAEKSEAFMQHMKLVGTAVDGLKMRLGIQLMPAMDAFLVKLKDLVVGLSPKVVKGFSDALGKLLDQLPTLLTLFSQFLEWVAGLVPKVAKFLDGLRGMKTVMTAVAGLMAAQFIVGFVQLAATLAGGAAAVFRFIGFLGALIEIAPAAAGAMELLDFAMDANPIGVVVLAIGALIAICVGLAFAAKAVYDHWTDVFDWWIDTWEKIKGPIEALFPPIKWIATAAGLIYRNWDGIGAWFTDHLGKVEAAFKDTWKRIEDLTPPWLKTLFGIGVSALNPLANIGAIGDIVGRVLTHPGKEAGGAQLSTPDLQRRMKKMLAEPHPGVTPASYLHIHVTSDGTPQVKAVKATGLEIAVSRGAMVA